MSPEEALANATRLLAIAEGDTDRQMMERLNCLADSWIAVAEVLSARENA